MSGVESRWASFWSSAAWRVWGVGRAGAAVTEGLAYVGTVAVIVLAGSVVGPWVRRSIAGGVEHEGRIVGQDWNRVDKKTTSPELCQAEGCPDCRKVRNFCTRAGSSVVLHNPRTAGAMVTPGRVTNETTHENLTRYGKDQIPLLVDTERDVAIYEIDEIIDYLREQYV